MPNLTDSELDAIEARAELQFRYGDFTALRAEDVADLLKEVRSLQQHNAHLIALYRQTQNRLIEHVAAYSGGSIPEADLEFP